MDGNGSEIGQSCSRADRGELGYGDGDFIILKLIFEAFNLWERGVDP
jgi:hypothetical protein